MKNILKAKIKQAGYVFGIVISAGVIGMALQFAKAWSEPTASAPGGNIGAPINTSGIGQAKAGGLVLNTAGAINGLIVQSGNVGIGTAAPIRALHINGELSISRSDKVAYINVSDASGSGSGTIVLRGLDNGGSAGAPAKVLVQGNLGLGTADPNGSKGADGYVQAKDFYISDTGKWASELGGGSRIIGGGICLTFKVNNWGEETVVYGAGVSCSPAGWMRTLNCPPGSTKIITTRLNNAGQGGEGGICIQ